LKQRSASAHSSDQIRWDPAWYCERSTHMRIVSLLPSGTDQRI
jgi:hypothetical protein